MVIVVRMLLVVKRWLKGAIVIIQKASDEDIVCIVECDPMERALSSVQQWDMCIDSMKIIMQ